MRLLITALAISAAASVSSAQSALWSATGHVKGGQFGAAVAYVPDVNGDGIADVAVGAPDDDTAGVNAGAVYVYSGVNGSLLRIHLGAAPGDRFGTSVCGLSGTTRYAIGAPFSDAAGTDAGQVTLYASSSGNVVATLNGGPGDRFGSAIASSAESVLFGVSAAHFAVGAPYRDVSSLSNCGTVYVYDALTSSPSLLNAFSGVQANQHFGAAVALRSLAYQIGGGLPTTDTALAVGSPDYDNGPNSAAGRANFYLRSGAATTFAATATATGAAGDHFGSAIAGVTDINNDHVADFWVGAPYADAVAGSGNSEGRIYLISAASGSPITFSAGFQANSHFGAAITALGAVGPTASAIAVGAPDFDIDANHTDAGLISYKNAGTGATVLQSIGTTAGQRLGAALQNPSIIEDVNGNTTGDVIVGDPNNESAGADAGGFRIIDVGAGQQLYSVDGPTSGDRFGTAVASVSDITGQSSERTLMIGSPNADRETIFPIAAEYANCGRVELFDASSGTLLRTHYGITSAAQLGWSLAPVGDVDGDGREDYAAGAPNLGPGASGPGSVVLYSGATGAAIRTIAGIVDGDGFGYSVCGAGDVNNDGVVDVAAGAPFYAISGNVNSGAAQIYRGDTGASLGSISGGNGDEVGFAVAYLGDYNGDGRSEILVGAPFYDGANGSNCGRVRVMGFFGSIAYSKDGDAANDHFGFSLVGGLNLDGDAVPDWAAGAPDANFGSITDSGIVRAYTGAGTLLFTWFSGTNDHLGMSVCAAGDVDFDGFDDVAIGAAPGTILGPTAPGFVQLRSGHSGIWLNEISGTDLKAQFARSIGFLGDATGDQTPELAVGSPIDGAAGNGAGGAKVYNLRPTGLSFYGSQHIGCSGAQALTGNMVPAIGSMNFRICGSHSPANALGLLLVGSVPDTTGTDVLGIGIRLDIDLLASSELYGYDITSNAAGFASLSVPIPMSPALQGKKYYMQSIWGWTAACPLPPYNLSSSRGLSLTFQ